MPTARLRDDPPWAWVALAFLLLVGLFLRLSGIGTYLASGDDIYHMKHAASGTPWQIVQVVVGQDMHPPGYYLALAAWMSLGEGLPHARLFSVLCSTLSIAAAYVMGRLALGSAAGGITCATVVTLAGNTVIQGQTVRHYSLLLLCIHLTWIGWLSHARRATWLYAVSAALTAFTAYIGLALVAITGGMTLLGRLRSGQWWRPSVQRWVLLHLGIAAVCAVMLGYYRWTGNQLPAETYLRGAMIDDLRGVGGGILDVLSRQAVADRWRISSMILVPWWFAGVGSCIVRRRWPLLSLIALPPMLAVLLAWAHIYPLGEPRWTLWTLPSLALAVAAGVDGLAMILRPRNLVPIVVLSLGIWMYALGFVRPNTTYATLLDPLRAREIAHWPARLEDYRRAVELVATQLDRAGEKLLYRKWMSRFDPISNQGWPIVAAERLFECPFEYVEWDLQAKSRREFLECARAAVHQEPALQGAWVILFQRGGKLADLERCGAWSRIESIGTVAVARLDVAATQAALPCP